VSIETIQSLGEKEALRRTVIRLTGSSYALVGSGDDAAQLKSEGSFLVSTDTLVQDHDFRLDWSSGFDLGFKAVASNLADIAAMGGEPTALVVAVVAPKETTIAWLEDFADGLESACKELAPGCGVVGGDLASGEQMVIAVTVHGKLVTEKPVLRSGAKVGDLVAVTGSLGFAAAGLSILQSNNQDFIRSYDEWVSWQLRPRPPISQGVVAAKSLASAMLDQSDGLLIDLERIAIASAVTIDIDSTALKGFEARLELPAQALEVDPKDWVLYGGEDHALLATFPSEAEIPKGFKVIGSVIEQQSSSVLIDANPVAILGWDSVIGSGGQGN
jgi:thiamine-monophosphate kinase